ncbi:MAG: hypothetical protein ACK5RL_10750 [Acidimicrobiales bacterium]
MTAPILMLTAKDGEYDEPESGTGLSSTVDEIEVCLAHVAPAAQPVPLDLLGEPAVASLDPRVRCLHRDRPVRRWRC